MNTQTKLYVPTPESCFELFGYDIMVDDRHKCWLIEVNTGPSLNGSTPLDVRIKSHMVADLVHMAGPVPYDKDEIQAEADARDRARLLGTAAAAASAAGAVAGAPFAGGGGAAGSGSGSGAATPALGGGTSASLSSGAATAVLAAIVAKRDTKALDEGLFSRVPLGDLPDVIRYSEAEHERRR